MHFSIPDTQDCSDSTGSSYTVFNLHVNGAYHCSVRYSKFFNFNEQLKKIFGANALPTFPPKKILSLSSIQLEERRCLLERYIQLLSQNPGIVQHDVFKNFLLSAQQESQKEHAEDVVLDVYLVNGHNIRVDIKSTDQTEEVLETVATQIELADEFVYYFGLFLVRKEDDGDNSIVRRLQDFESPYISLKAANKEAQHRIVLRKSYWDPAYDDNLIDDRIAMNLIYVQAVNDIERGWVTASKDQHKQLLALQKRGSKKEYLRFARTLKFYGFLQFHPCITDYPENNCRALVSAGNKEVVFQVQTQQGEIKEAVFRVTRMRCWRITSTPADGNKESPGGKRGDNTLEIAFEYLMAKDTLQWVTIISDQAILVSLCLQGMVDELLMKKAGANFKTPHNRKSKTTVQRQAKSSNGLLKRVNATSHSSPLPSSTKDTTANPVKEHVRRISDKIASVGLKSKDGMTEMNDAFEGIGDDDL